MKTSIKKYDFNKIPILEYTSESANRLIFLLHPLYSNKEQVMQMMGVQLVRLGYQVIAIDALNHGERLSLSLKENSTKESTLDIYEIVEKTTQDLVMIYHHYFAQKYQIFDVAGISMGGLTGYYLSTQIPFINHLIVWMATPDFETLFHYQTSHYQIDTSNPKYKAEIKRVKRINPIHQKAQMHFNQLMILHGEKDQVVPFELTEKWLIKNEKPSINFRLYPTNHRLTKAMIEDVFTLLKNPG